MANETPLHAISAPKLATIVARQIESDVIALGWPVGEVLGSEAELLRRFGVSRAVFREAVRIVEHTGSASMRRGPGGGLIVSAPNRAAITAAVGIWLSYVRVSAAEIFDARAILINEAIRRAAERPDRPAIDDIRLRMKEMDAMSEFGEPAFTDLDRRLFGLSDNPAIVLFADATTALLASRFRNERARLNPPATPDDSRRHLRGLRKLTDALLKGDPATALQQLHRLNEAPRSRLEDIASNPAGRRASLDRESGKLAEQVALALRDDIERAGWPVDSVLGSEPELIERYGVSRAILREGVRILEHDGAVRTKRGPGGGLVVSVPDSAAMVHAAGMALEFEKVTYRQLLDVRSALEIAAVRMAAARMSNELATTLSLAVSTARDTGGVGRNVHQSLAEASGCRPLALFVQVISKLLDGRVRPLAAAELSSGLTADQIHRAHDRIVAATVAGDGDLAARRLRRYQSAGADLAG